MPVEGPGPQQLRDLSLRLRAMGSEGKGLQRKLYKAINDAGEPFKRQIQAADWLKPYMPDRYAEVLAGDEKVTVVKRGGARASVALQVTGRLHRREVARINAGLLRHPVFGNRKVWRTQPPGKGGVGTGGMRPGYFTDAAREQAPGIRDAISEACHAVAEELTS